MLELLAWLSTSSLSFPVIFWALCLGTLTLITPTGLPGAMEEKSKYVSTWPGCFLFIIIMSRRGATPSYESSQQSHIDDLVQRNRASEHAHRKLKEELTQEKARAKLAIQDIQNKLHAEKREWREVCDTLQTCHRIHQLRLQAELEKGKYQLLVEQELLRKEKVAALQRELAITKFQAQETSLEHRIEELEDKLAKLGQQLQDEKHASKAQILKLVTHMQTQEKELEAAEEARTDIQVRFIKTKSHLCTYS